MSPSARRPAASSRPARPRPTTAPFALPDRPGWVRLAAGAVDAGVDGIAVVAIDVNGIMPAVQQAVDAGIPVVAIDAILPEGPQSAQIGVDNAQAGADLAAVVNDALPEGSTLGIVGALNSFIQNVRMDGFTTGTVLSR